MAKTRKIFEWKDPGALTLAVTVLMAANIAIHLASLGVSVAYGPAAAYTGDEDEFTRPQFVRWATDMLQLLFYLPALTVIFWILRVSRNAHVFQPGLKISPLGAVAWYLVPFASLVKPFEAMSEIWSASAAPGEGGRSTLLNWWWGLFLLSGLMGSLVARLPELGPAARGTADILAIAVSVILILIARRLCQMQRAKHQAWDVFGAPEGRELGALERVSS